jgi:hypothetical protein
MSNGLPVLDFKIIDDRKTLSMWDFGGQAEYFVVHDLFLTRGAVYVLVVDWTKGVEAARESAQRWMDAIRAHVDDALVLPVLPRCDHVRHSADKKVRHDVAREIEKLVGRAPIRVDGNGVEKSAETAVKWYTKAAELGNSGAMFNLGVCYKTAAASRRTPRRPSSGTRRRPSWATRTRCSTWACATKRPRRREERRDGRQVVHQGGRAGQLGRDVQPGRCYKNGDGVEKSAETAVKWYTKAAELGDSDAMFNLGVCYENGRGVEKSAETAVKWYTKAAELGHSTAMSTWACATVNGATASRRTPRPVPSGSQRRQLLGALRPCSSWAFAARLARARSTTETWRSRGSQQPATWAMPARRRRWPSGSPTSRRGRPRRRCAGSAASGR